VIAARKLSSAMSAAKATCDHLRDWWHGTKEVRFVSQLSSAGMPALTELFGGARSTAY